MNKGAFHRYLGIKEGRPIPMGRVMAALKSGNKHVRAMAQFAKNMKGAK